MGENYNTGTCTIRVGRDYVCLNFGSNLATSASVRDRGTRRTRGRVIRSQGSRFGRFLPKLGPASQQRRSDPSRHPARCTRSRRPSSPLLPNLVFSTHSRCGPCDGAMTLPSGGPIASSPVAKVSGVVHIVEGLPG